MLPADFLVLLLGSKALVGNSSVGIRECAYLGVPAVNIGSRQANRQRGANVIDVGHDEAEILGATRTQIDRGHYSSDPLYGSGQAGRVIARRLYEM
jgi:UDP-N-acetylglucosamine 2-epimerase